jgi:hypothetical protein
MPRAEDFEWRGKYQEVEVTDYWCPSERQWTCCDEPCPNGSLHYPVRRKILARLMEPKT